MYARAGSKSHKGTNIVLVPSSPFDRDPRAPYLKTTNDRRHSAAGRFVIRHEIDRVTDLHNLTFSFWVRVLFQKAKQKFAGIGPGPSSARFPTLQSRESQVEEVGSEKRHRFGLRKAVGLTPQNK